MASVALTTSQRSWQRGYQANVLTPFTESTLFTSNVLGTTMPSVSGGGAYNTISNNLAKLMFFGNGSENTQFYAHVYTWAPFGPFWVPTPVCQVLCQLSAVIGVAGSSFLIETDRIVDGIGLIEGDPTVKIVSDFDNRVSSLLVDLEGAHFLSVRFSTTSLASPATGCNYAFSAF